MKKINPEIKGLLGIILAILIIGFILAASTGKLDKYGITLFSGPKIYDSILVSEHTKNKDKLIAFNIEAGTQKTILEADSISDIDISPNGGKIVYIGYKDDSPQVFTINPDGKKNKAITNSDGGKYLPKFSSDGLSLAYINKGRIFKSDPNGTNAKAIIPTKQQLQQFVSDRGEQLTCKDYVWSKAGKGMLAVVSKGENKDRFVLMMDSYDAHEIPFPEEFKMQVIGITAAETEDAYVASTKINDDFYAIFVIQVPEKHSHDMTIPETPEKYGCFPIYQSKDELGYPSMAPSQSAILISARKTEKDQKNEALFTLNIEDKKMSPVLAGFYTQIKTPAFTEGIVLESEENKVIFYDINSSKETILSENSTSVCLSPQKPEK